MAQLIVLSNLNETNSNESLFFKILFMFAWFIIKPDLTASNPREMWWLEVYIPY